MTGMWGAAARKHWQRHLPDRLAALEIPDRFFADLDDDASAYYAAVRDAQLQGVNPNDGTVSWADFVDRVAWANQIARELVETELIYIPSEQNDAAEGPE